MADVRHHTTVDGLDQYIPVRKSEILTALAEQGAFATDEHRGKYDRLSQTLTSICHYLYFDLLDRLRHDYYYFSPDVAQRAACKRSTIEGCYDDLQRSLEAVLTGANFRELPHAELNEAHRQRSVLRVEIRAPLEDFREVRLYGRGRHAEKFEVSDWFGLRRRVVEADVYDDVVLMVAAKSREEISSLRELRRLERRKIVPGSVLLKYFRNIANSDLKALFPNARVVLSNVDKLVIGIPAIAGGIPIALNLYASVTVLFLVIGFYLGLHGTVEDKDMKTALAALAALAALGGFLLTQWVKYQRQSLKHQIELTDNVYYRNINNNAGVFDYIIGAAENQSAKEALLAYHFLAVAGVPPTADELDGSIEAWLLKSFALDVDFKIERALATLERLGLLRHHGDRLGVLELDAAFAQLQHVWAEFLPARQQPVAAE